MQKELMSKVEERADSATTRTKTCLRCYVESERQRCEFTKKYSYIGSGLISKVNPQICIFYLLCSLYFGVGRLRHKMCGSGNAAVCF